jgi:hypothetical protein
MTEKAATPTPAPRQEAGQSGGQQAAGNAHQSRIPTGERLAALGRTPANPQEMLYLQRTVGNHAVTRLLAQTRSHAATPPVQAKLSVGPADDRYEREADRVADTVMRAIRHSTAPDPEAEETQTAGPLAATLQRAPEAVVGLEGGALGADVEREIRSARGRGRPLEPGVRRRMEQHMGADFGGVKVHTNRDADRLSRSIQARAFTTGQDIFFRNGAYQPGSRGGQQLLAHELTHVVQQNGNKVARKPTPQTARHTDDTLIQRSIGFEFQTNWGIVKNVPDPTYKKSLGAKLKGLFSRKKSGKGQEAPKQGYVPPQPGRKHERFRKAHDHLTDGHVKLSTDDAGTETGAEIEWVIDPPLPDDIKPEELDDVILTLMMRVAQLYAFKDRNSFFLSEATGDPAHSEIEIQPGIKSNGKRNMAAAAQITGGIKFNQLWEVFQDVADNARVTDPERQKGVGSFKGSDSAKIMVDAVIKSRVEGSNELKALLAFIVRYTLMNVEMSPESIKAMAELGKDEYHNAADYAKVNTQFLARTDFATMFNMLPVEERRKYGGPKHTEGGTDNSPAFVALVAQVLKEAYPSRALNMDDPVFGRGIKGDKTTRTVIRFPLTRRDWLSSMANGEDKLSGASAYAKQQGYAEQLESMGNIGGKAGKLDKVSSDLPGKKSGVIIEFRSNTEPQEPAKWVDYIRQAVAYIQEINTRKSMSDVQDWKLMESSHKARSMNFWN